MKILLIDDKKTNHLYMKRVLQPFGEVVEAMHGEEGYQLFKAAHQKGAPFDLIFCDLIMPVWDGHKTINNIRKEEKRENWDPVRIVALTSLRSESTKEKVTEEGADDFLSKPLNRIEIEEYMQKLEL